MIDDKKLLELTKRAATSATRAGAQDAQVFMSRSREISVEWRDGKLDRIRESTSQGLAISLFVDGRYSANSTSDIRPDAVDRYVENAVKTTKYLAADKHRKLPDPARYKNRTVADLGRYDSAISTVTPKQRLATAKRLEHAARANDASGKIISVSSWVGDAQSIVVGFSTNGFEASQHGTNFSCGVDISIQGEGDRKPSGWDYGATRYLADLPDVIALGKTAYNRAVAQVGSKQAPTDKYEIIIENRAVPTLSRHLFSPLFGGSIQQKRSFFDGKIGTQIGSEVLSVTSDPLLVRGLSSTAFDNEGMSTVRRPVFEAGVLKTFFLSTYYASKLKMAPTSSSKFNLVWTPGTRDASAMIKDVKKGLLITSFLGGNSNSTTGDFSLGIKGHYIENGKLMYPISEMNMAGNHLEFWKSLQEVGNDPWIYSSNRSPTLRFTDVQCSGA